MSTQTLESSTQKFRRFGSVGPAYEIIDVVRDLPNGDRVLRIRVLETGEEAEYPLSHALEDPQAD